MLNTNAPTYTMEQLRTFDGRVRRIIHRTGLVMHNHRLPVLFKGWVLTATPDGIVVLIGVLNDDRIMAETNVPLARYLASNVIDDISTTAGDGQYPVVRCNHSGAGYAVVLQAPEMPCLPEAVGFPGYQPGRLLWGVTYGDQVVATDWVQHVMLAGKTGSGKSTALRSVVAQAIWAGHQVALCDVGQQTFPMFEQHPALLAPLETTPEGAVRLARAVEAEIERRKVLFSAVEGYPEMLAEYNQAAQAQDREILKRLVVVFDEYTDTLLALGGGDAAFSNLMTRLVIGARKWGITFVFAGHHWQKSAAGWVREQCAVRLCLQVEDRNTAMIVVESAEPARFKHKGRALMKGAGHLQLYRVDKSALIELGRQPAGGLRLTPQELQLARAIGAHKFNLENVMRAADIAERAARRLIRDWDQRGLCAKAAEPGGARYLTAEVLRLATETVVQTPA